MKEIIAFFKDIFMISDQNSKMKVGLSQFKDEEPEEKKPVKKVQKIQKDVKLSDLMRRSAKAFLKCSTKNLIIITYRMKGAKRWKS